MAGFKLANDSSQSRLFEMPHAAVGADQPLDLTVHTLPIPELALDAHTTRTRGGRWKMLAVMLVCAAPVIASYFSYYVLRPDGRRNFGELINPQRSLPDLTASDVGGQSVNLRTLKGQWLLVNVASGTCDELCNQNLYLQRQMRESLGKDKDRLDRVWLITDDKPIDAKLQTALLGATVLKVQAGELSSWLQPSSGQTLADHLYVIDPMGNWMMRFPPRMDAAGATKAKRDLERLLRASASWDTAGR